MADKVTNYYVGIDGGGTKTKIYLEDEQGKQLAKALSGPANIRLSIDQARHSIIDGLEQVQAQSGINFQKKNIAVYGGLALAGTEVKADCKAFLAKPLPFKDVVLHSDAYAACLGAHSSLKDCHDGTIIIIGTGVIGYQLYQGQHFQVGGWGFPHDDEGGGAWLGLQALQHTFKVQDNRQQKSPLARAIMNHFKNNFAELVAWANRANSSQFAQLAPIVIEQCKKKEQIACNIMQQAVLAITDIHRALCKTIDKVLPCSLFGGIAPHLQPLLPNEVQQTLVPRKHDATQGAVFMIRQHIKAKQQ